MKIIIALFISIFILQAKSDTTLINFYKTELDKTTAEFIEADEMYEIFHGRVKQNLALNCLSFFLHKNGVVSWYDKGISYKKEAKRKYITDIHKKNKAKKNELFIGAHYNDLDMLEIKKITDKIANRWDLNSNTQTCVKGASTQEMFEIFIPKYIYSLQNSKQYAINGLIIEEEKFHPIFKEQIQQISSWTAILYTYYPQYNNYQERQTLLKLEKQKVQKSKEIANRMKIQKHKKEFWDKLKVNKRFHYSKYITLLNTTNKKGQTPIMVAALYDNHLVVSDLCQKSVKTSIKDKYGKTVFDYFKKSRAKEDKKYTLRAESCLEQNHIKNIIGNRAKISYISSGKGKNSVTIYDGICEDFKFPSNTKCYEAF